MCGVSGSIAWFQTGHSKSYVNLHSHVGKAQLLLVLTAPSQRFKAPANNRELRVEGAGC